MAIQHNVQQQNDLLLEKIFLTTKLFRQKGIAKGIRKYLAKQSIDFDQCVVIYAHTESFILGYQYGFRGLIVSPEGRFFDIYLELNDEQSEVVFVHDFADVTSEQNFSTTNKGTGKGLGCLALTALQSLKYD